MTALWQHHNAHPSRQNRYIGMSQGLLLQKMLELVDQMQETMKASVEKTRQFGSHLHNLKHNLLAIAPDIENEEAVHEHLQNADPAPTLFETFDNPPQSGFLQDAVDDSIIDTKFEPMDEPPMPAVTEPNVMVQLWRIDSRAMNEPPLLSKINPLDAQLVTEVMKQNVEKPFPPLVVFDNNEQLSLADRSVELQLVARKHRWRWKPVDDDENAVANNSAGAVNGSHRAPRVFSSYGCYSYVSLTNDEEATGLDAPRCTNGCYMAVDYLRHLNDIPTWLLLMLNSIFLKIGHALLQAWPWLLETQRPAPSQIWNSFVFQHMTKWAEFPWWRTSWVSIPGGRDLLHLSWKRKGRVPKSGGRGLRHLSGYPITFLIVSQIFMIPAQAPKAKFMGQEGESMAVSAPLLEETQRTGTVEPDRVLGWREQITLKELAVSVVLWTLFCIITHKLILTVRIIPSLNVSAGMLGFFFFKSWSNFLSMLGFSIKLFPGKSFLLVNPTSSLAMALHVNETGSAPAATRLDPSDSASQVPFILNFLSTVELHEAPPTIFFLQSASPQFNLVHELFTNGKSRFGVVPNVFTCQFLIKGICKKHKVKGAVTMLDEMPVMGMIPNLVTYTTILVLELFFFVKLWTSLLSELGLSIKPSPGTRTQFFRPASSLPLALHLAGVLVRICLHRMRRTTDCVYFLASLLACKKGIACEYRHSAIARLNSSDCWYWLSGDCLNPACVFRHPPLVGPAGPTTKNASRPMAGTPVPWTDEMAGNTLAGTLSFKTDVKPGMQFGNPKFVSVGSCCLVGILCAKQLYIANTRDSRLVLGRQEQAVNVAKVVQLSSEHNASGESVREALHSLHSNDPQIVGFKNKVWCVQGLIHASLGNAHIESAERWESSPGYDVLVKDKSMNLRYEDDPEYLLDFDREH